MFSQGVKAREESLEAATIFDNVEKINWTEKAVFACEVVQTNERGLDQLRVLLLTTEAVYHFKPGSLNAPLRVIPLKSVVGVICSESSTNFAVRVLGEHDYIVRPATNELRDVLLIWVKAQVKKASGSELLVNNMVEPELFSYIVAEADRGFKVGLEKHFRRFTEERNKILKSLQSAPPSAAAESSNSTYAFDHLDISHKKAAIKTLTELNLGLQVLFSDAVFKFVDATEVETRHFVVTPQGLLDFPPGQYQHVSAILQFQDITDVLVARKSFEVVLQISDSVDYRFKFESRERRDQFVRVMCEQYKRVMRHRVAFEMVDADCLLDHTCPETMLPLKRLMESEIKTSMDLITQQIAALLQYEPPKPIAIQPVNKPDTELMEFLAAEEAAAQAAAEAEQSRIRAAHIAEEAERARLAAQQFVAQSHSAPAQPDIREEKVEAVAPQSESRHENVQVVAPVEVRDDAPSAVSLMVDAVDAEPVKSAEDRKRALLAAKRLKAEMLLQQQMLEEAERPAEVAKEEIVVEATPPASMAEIIALVAEPEPIIEAAIPSEAAPQEHPHEQPQDEVAVPSIADPVVAPNSDANPSAVSIETKPTSVSADMLKSFGSSMAKRNKLFAKK